MIKVKAIVVDYGGVLVEAPSNPENMARIAQEIGIDATTLKDGVYGKNREFWNRAKLGLISETDHWVEVEKNLQLPTSKIQWIKHQLFESPVVHDEFIHFLKQLRGQYSLAILSNAIPVFSQTWAQLGFTDLFDVMINSSLVKLAKPDPEIYKLTTEYLDLPANDCIFVDDQVKNLEIAAHLGFQIVHYVDSKQAIETITKLIGDGVSINPQD
jgi:putative hydrolase of the HAD superfamily